MPEVSSTAGQRRVRMARRGRARIGATFQLDAVALRPT
jgi:hypothetical protein